MHTCIIFFLYSSMWVTHTGNEFLKAGWLCGFVKQVKPDNKACALNFLGLGHCLLWQQRCELSQAFLLSHRLLQGRLMLAEGNICKQYIYFWANIDESRLQVPH